MGISMEWLFGIFLVSLLGLLVYSVVSTSLTIRKKVQPSVDSFFDLLYAVVFMRRRTSKGDPTSDHAKKE